MEFQYGLSKLFAKERMNDVCCDFKIKDIISVRKVMYNKRKYLVLSIQFYT